MSRDKLISIKMVGDTEFDNTFRNKSAIINSMLQKQTTINST